MLALPDNFLMKVSRCKNVRGHESRDNLVVVKRGHSSKEDREGQLVGISGP